MRDVVRKTLNRTWKRAEDEADLLALVNDSLPHDLVVYADELDELFRVFSEYKAKYGRSSTVCIRVIDERGRMTTHEFVAEGADEIRERLASFAQQL